MEVTPYLFFEGRCEEASAFYKKAVGAQVLMQMRFKEAPDQSGCPEGSGEKIMHMSMKIGDSLVQASDGRCSGTQGYQGFALSLTPANDADAEKYFKALSEGGQVQMPLAKTFFASKFGMLADRFGIMWMIYVKPA